MARPDGTDDQSVLESRVKHMLEDAFPSVAVKPQLPVGIRGMRFRPDLVVSSRDPAETVVIEVDGEQHAKAYFDDLFRDTLILTQSALAPSHVIRIPTCFADSHPAWVTLACQRIAPHVLVDPLRQVAARAHPPNTLAKSISRGPAYCLVDHREIDEEDEYPPPELLNGDGDVIGHLCAAVWYRRTDSPAVQAMARWIKRHCNGDGSLSSALQRLQRLGPPFRSSRDRLFRLAAENSDAASEFILP